MTGYIVVCVKGSDPAHSRSLFVLSFRCLSMAEVTAVLTVHRTIAQTM